MNYARRLARRLSTRRSSGAAPKKLRRRLFTERLEERSLLAGNVAGFISDYYNQGRPADVNADGEVSPLDALLVINQLNAGRAGLLPQGAAGAAGEGSPGRLYVDVNNDGEAAPLDALLVINALNAEGEDPFDPATDVVRYEIRALAPGTNTAITTVGLGQQFDLQIRVQDARPAETPAASNVRGVFTAFTDILISELSATDNDAILDLFTVGIPEIQTITINTTPASGNFTLTFGGQTTAPIALNDSEGNPLPAADVRTDISNKLQALSNVGAGNVLVIANNPTTFSVRFIGNKYNVDQPLMTTNAGADITVVELNPSDPQALIEAFRSVPIPGAGGTGSNFQTLLDAAIAPDRFDDVGAVDLRTDGSTPGTAFQEVIRVRLIANQVNAGSITFVPDFADLEPSQHDTNVYSSTGANPIALGRPTSYPARVSAVTSASNFTSNELLVYPTTVTDLFVGSTIEFLGNSPAAALETDPSNPTGPLIPSRRTITAYNAATGEITVNAPFPGTPRLQGQAGATEDDSFQIALNIPITDPPTPVPFIDLVGATPPSITVTIVSGPYDAIDDLNVTGNEDQAGGIVFNVLANDQTQPPTGQTTNIVSVTQPASGGTVTFSPTGNITFTPATNFNGGPVTFTYTGRNITAGAASQTDTATVVVNVNAVNDAPTITAPGAQNVNEGGGTQTVNVTGLTPGGGADEAGQTVTLLAESSNPGAVGVIVNGNSVVLTGGTAGTATITLRAVDTGTPNATTTVTFSATSAAVNDPPDVTAPPSATTDVDTNLTLSAANGNKISVTDPDAGGASISLTLTVSTGSIQGGTGNTRVLTGSVSSIQSTLDSGITYIPPAGFDGAVTLTAVANDNGNTGAGGPQTDTATVNITVQPAVPKPIADNDTFNGATEETQFIVPAPGVLDGDTDPLERLPLTAVAAFMPANFGTIVLDPLGSFTYNPAPEFSGPASFTYRAQASDGTQSNPATVTINVTGTNDPPTGVPDGSTASPIVIVKLIDPSFANQPINVVANDTDVDSPQSSLVVAAGSLSAPGKGTVSISGDGKQVLYTPNAGAEGLDSFTYRVTDGQAESGDTLVTVNIVNFVPKDVSGTVFLDSDNNGQIFGGETFTDTNGNGRYDVGEPFADSTSGHYNQPVIGAVDGVFDGPERRLSNIELRLSGVDFQGNALQTVIPANSPGNPSSTPITVPYLTVRTDANGNYTFAGVSPPQPGTSYQLTQVQPNLFIDGLETNSLSSPLASVTSTSTPHLDQFTLSWSITDQTPLNGLNFAERGIDMSLLGDITKAEQTAKASQDGFWLATDLSGNTLWTFKLNGWDSATTFDVDFTLSDLAHATLTVNGVSRRIHQNPSFNSTAEGYPPGANISTPTDIGPRFRVYGANGNSGALLFRIDGTPADFNLPGGGPVASAGEGEGMSNRNFAEGADEVFGANGWA